MKPKRITAIILTTVMTLGTIFAFAIPLYAASLPGQIRIRLDGQFIDTGDRPPVIIDGRTLVPLRATMEALGFYVGWNGITGTATMIKPGYGIAVTIDSRMMVVNTPEVTNKTVSLEVPPQLINGRTMVPVRAISEATGFEVNWDGESRIVDVNRQGSSYDNVESNKQNNNVITNVYNGSNINYIQNNDVENVITETMIPVLFDTLALLTSDELMALAATAPNYIDTRSATILPSDRRLTGAELDAWVAEYKALGGINSFELEVIRLINEYRASHGLNPLAISTELSMAARFKAQGRLDLNYSGHWSPIYGNALDRAEMFGHVSVDEGWHTVLENIAGGQPTPERVLQTWLNSPGHRAAILTTGPASSVGIGRVGFSAIMKIGF